MKNNYQYKTKSGQTISFELLPIKEELIKSRLFDSFSIQARVANEVVGYAKLIFISSEKAKKLLEPFDFFIYKIYGSTDSVVESYEKNNYKFLLGKLALNELKISSVELEQMPTKTINNLFFEFKEKINNDYKGQFNSFMDYWVNKPQLEIIRVFSNKDDSFIILLKYSLSGTGGRPFIITNEIFMEPERWHMVAISDFDKYCPKDISKEKRKLLKKNFKKLFA